LTVRELCDVAEVLLLREAAVTDQLYLMAAIAKGLGSKGLDDYVTPAEK